jgi:coenzyme PQQ biosynthesis protein PqqD
MSAPRLSPGVRLSIDPIGGEPILLYPEGYVVLNATAYEVVSRCDGAVSVDQIVHLLAEEYDATPENLHNEVCECLTNLKQLRLIDWEK